jgi:hypothetical protein
VVELSRMIRELRREITQAVEAVDEERPDLRFEVGTIQLEASVQVTVEAQAGGKLRFWVLEAGSEVKGNHATVHKVTVPLTPRLYDDTGADAKPRTPQVSGPAVEGED